MTNEKQMTIYEHLGAFRKVLITCAIATALTSVVGWLYAEKIIVILTSPITALKYNLIVISVTEALFTKLKVAVFTGLLLALPVILYQLWTFLLPALKTSEKKYLRYLVPMSFFLFIAGIAFGFKVVFPLGVKVLLTTFVVGSIVPMVTLSNYLSFTIAFLLPFGLIFELPLIILFLSKLGIVSPKYLKEKRKYAILIIFVVAAALTPGPDVISQLLMAAPMYILYEASILVSRFVYKKRAAIDGGPLNG